jgi:hypothetical protein
MRLVNLFLWLRQEDETRNWSASRRSAIAKASGFVRPLTHYVELAMKVLLIQFASRNFSRLINQAPTATAA